jgi:hypothetical protein
MSRATGDQWRETTREGIADSCDKRRQIGKENGKARQKGLLHIL